MITLNTGKATLTTLNTRHLLGLTVKLLDFPAQATHVLSSLRRVLSHVVGSDIVRALGRKHQPEHFHLMPFGKILNVQGFALLKLVRRPIQAIHPLITNLSATVID